MRTEWESLLREQSGDNEALHFDSMLESEQMALFDFGVSSWHGRTSGKWAHSETIW